MNNRTHVAPAYIPMSRHELDTFLLRTAAFTSDVQVDVVDGVFVPTAPVSWPYAAEGDLADTLRMVSFHDRHVEVDLMCTHPEDELDAWVGTGAAALVVHVESTEKLNDILAHAGRRAYKLGLAFNNDTDLSLLDELDLSCVDYVQLMGIATIGVQGQSFDERVLSRIRELKEKYPELPIQIDGSVNKDTFPRLVEAGADRFVAGSAIMGTEDPARAQRELEEIYKQMHM